MHRHPETEPLVGVLACCAEASLLYLNAEYVEANILAQIEMASPRPIKNVVCDLSASPSMDLARARMLSRLYDTLQGRGIALAVINAHGRVHDPLCAEWLGGKAQGIARGTSLEAELQILSAGSRSAG